MAPEAIAAKVVCTPIEAVVLEAEVTAEATMTEVATTKATMTEAATEPAKSSTAESTATKTAEPATYFDDV
ncbi:MAG: hypothetical protein ACR2PI_07635 [Hyphomicrobiaceae bacterium]